MKHFLFSFVLFLGLNNLYSQSFDWAKQMGGTVFETAYSLSVDSFGNVYTAGFFQGTADFDPGPGIFNMTSAGSDDIFISKLDSNGNFIWAKRIGGTLSDDANSITTDSKGNSFTTGRFSGTADFDPGAGTFNLSSAGGNDVFICKLDSGGNFVWAKKFGGTSADGSLSITLDKTGNVYTTGFFNTTVDFDPGPGTNNITVLGASDIFINKLDAFGNFVWARRLGGTSGDQSQSITTDGSGNVYTTGFFIGTADFDPGAATFNFISPGQEDVFISKLDSNGNFVWAKQLGGTSSEYGLSILIASDKSIYTSGKFNGPLDFNPGAGTYTLASNGNYDAFVNKLDSSGNFLWAKSWGGTLSDYGNAIDKDFFGNIFIIGEFNTTVDFNPGTGTYNKTTNGADDIYINKLDKNGNFKWVKTFGSTTSDGGKAIHVTRGGSIYSAGYFYLTTDFDPNSGVSNLTSKGGDDIFVHKMGHCQSTSPVIHPVSCNSYLSPSGIYTFTVSGTYVDTVLNAIGCDSIIPIDLTIIHRSAGTLSLTVCDNYISPSGNYTYNSSGTYLDTIPNSVGCDSVITINLTIKNSTSSVISQAVCNSYTSPSGNHTYNSSGIYKDTISNSIGCDSIITIDLTIKNNSTSTISPSVCYSYTTPSGNNIYSSGGTYMDTIPNASGCDSIITINLTIHNNTPADISPHACYSYVSPSGNYTYTTSGVYKDTIPNIFGCDSIINITLTVDTVDVSVINAAPDLTANAVGAAFQWLDCTTGFSVIAGQTNAGFTATMDGNYAVSITQNGCTDTSACYLINGLSVSQNNFDRLINIYPNPVDKSINIKMGKESAEINVLIKNNLGERLMTKNFRNTSLITIETDFPEGVYFIYLRSDQGQISVFKIIKL